MHVHAATALKKCACEHRPFLKIAKWKKSTGPRLVDSIFTPDFSRRSDPLSLAYKQTNGCGVFVSGYDRATLLAIGMESVSMADGFI